MPHDLLRIPEEGLGPHLFPVHEEIEFRLEADHRAGRRASGSGGSLGISGGFRHRSISSPHCGGHAGHVPNIEMQVVVGFLRAVAVGLVRTSGPEATRDLR